MDLFKLPEKAKIAQKSNKKLIQKLKKEKGKYVDELWHSNHDKVFCQTDCLKCANCCKTTGPLFINKDIERIAKHLRLKPADFIDQYLKIDEDGDYVLKSTPCAFLGEDNYCSIYDVRPRACAEYPHTDRVKQQQILNLNLKNAQVCPAVYEMFEEIKRSIP